MATNIRFTKRGVITHRGVGLPSSSYVCRVGKIITIPDHMVEVIAAQGIEFEIVGTPKATKEPKTKPKTKSKTKGGARKTSSKTRGRK